jgi:GT2 family glycosyltransferase
MVFGRLFGARRERSELRRRAAALAAPPSFSVIAADPAAAAELVYPAFEVVADLAAARGEFVAFVGPGERPARDALLAVAEAVAREPDADLVYSDEQVDGCTPFHKPDWSPALLLAQPYVLRFCAWRRDRVLGVGGLRAAAGAAQDYDLALRVGEAARRVVHVPQLLGRARAARPPAADDLRVAAEAAARQGLCAEVRRSRVAHVYEVSVRPRGWEPVTVIVPTRDRLDLLRVCVDSVLARTRHPRFSLLIVDNGSVEPATQVQLRSWQQDPRVRVLADPSPFNYSALMNRAVRAADTPLVALLNNDTEVLAPDWLAEMAGWMEWPSVGAVGARLRYGDGSIQHAGIVLGIGGVASHGHKGSPGDAAGYHGLLHSVRDVSAVTAACMLTRRDLFLDAGGFEEQLGVAYNDVDYCLRLRARGRRILFAPLAELHHFEGMSRGDDRRGSARFDREQALMQARWGAALRADPFYNPNLSLQATDYRLRR